MIVHELPRDRIHKELADGWLESTTTSRLLKKSVAVALRT